MVLMLVMGVLLAVGTAMAIGWSGHSEICTPPQFDGEAPELEEGLRPAAWRFARSFAIALTAGVGAGLLVAGAGGRLAMRALAATSPEATGRLTEADQVVGAITVDGTIGFMVFNGVFFGFPTGVLYLLIWRWLPPGRWRGIAFGAVLLALFAVRTEPLRPDNPDFGIVGPGWLALALFGGLVLLHGATVAAIAGRYSRVVPATAGRNRQSLAYLALLAPLVVLPLAIMIVLVGFVVAVVTRSGPLTVGPVARRRIDTAGRWVLAGLVALSAPSLLRAGQDIFSSSP